MQKYRQQLYLVHKVKFILASWRNSAWFSINTVVTTFLLVIERSILVALACVLVKSEIWANNTSNAKTFVIILIIAISVTYPIKCSKDLGKILNAHLKFSHFINPNFIYSVCILRCSGLMFVRLILHSKWNAIRPRSMLLKLQILDRSQICATNDTLPGTGCLNCAFTCN